MAFRKFCKLSIFSFSQLALRSQKFQKLNKLCHIVCETISGHYFRLVPLNRLESTSSQQVDAD